MNEQIKLTFLEIATLLDVIKMEESISDMYLIEKNENSLIISDTNKRIASINLKPTNDE